MKQIKIKIKEFMDPVGWVISKDGNKTRCKQSHYFTNKQNYISQWFPKEEDATTWFNTYITKKKPSSTMTLFEVIEQAKQEVKDKNETLVKAILYNAQKTKKITRPNLERLRQMVQLNNNDPNKVDQILKTSGIQIIGESLQKGELPLSYSGGIHKCEKCGSDHLTTGIIDPKRGFAKDNWMHKCLDCGNIVPIPPKIKESDTGGMAAFNAPFGEPEEVKVDSKGIRTRKSFKRKK